MPLASGTFPSRFERLTIQKAPGPARGSVRGTEVAALFYSMIETAKLTGVDPATYLRTAALRAIATPGTVTLPSDLAEN